MSTVKEHLRPLLFYGGLPFTKIVWRRFTGRKRIFILMFHKVSYHAPPLFGVAVKPDVFERQIRFLKKNFHVVDLSGLKRLESFRLMKKDIVVITFDDGYRNNYSHVFPVLKKYQVPATIFLATDYINTNNMLWHDQLSWILYKTDFIPERATLAQYDFEPAIHDALESFFVSDDKKRIKVLRFLAGKLKTVPNKDRENILHRLAQACRVNLRLEGRERVMLTWDEIREMSRGGVSFGSHTASHPVLSAISTSEAQREIIESRRAIEEQIQKPVRTFAYPYGKREDYTDNIVKILIDEGFEYACSADAGAEEYPFKNPLALKRKAVALSPYLFF